MSSESDKDQVYREARSEIGDFRFDKSVATVFDDMVSRSVPFYGEMQRMIVEIAARFRGAGQCRLRSRLFDRDDLHQSAPASRPQRALRRRRQFREMLVKCRAKLAEHGVDRPLDLQCVDLNEGVQVEDASLVMLVLTLAVHPAAAP